MRERRTERGFTLVELMLVVLILGTLATMLLPNYRRSLLKAQAADLVTKIEAINIAVKDYEADHGEPPVGSFAAGAAPPWLASYAPDRFFNAGSGITYQLVITTGSAAATLVVDAGTDPANIQMLLAAAGTLGNRGALAPGGTTWIVTLSN